MPVEIPYVRQMKFEYGEVAYLSPNIRRVVARNPSAFTFNGTGTYILGTGNVAVIDPGPKDTAHVNAILQAVRGETISHMLVTHTHNDHSPACSLLREHCDAKTYAFGPHGSGKFEDDGVVVEEGGDMDFEPDVTVRDGDVIEGDDWSVECVYTPGHTSNHICYSSIQDRTLFSGDHVMGWSTSVISPPDGDMAKYMESLSKLLERNEESYWPTHGPQIVEPKRHVRAFIAHRENRASQILSTIGNGVRKITDMVPLMYTDVDRGLYPAAARSVFAALLHLVELETVQCDGEPTLDSEYFLS